MKQYLYKLVYQLIVISSLLTVTVSPLFSQTSRSDWYSDYDVTHYLIDIKVSDTSKFISGKGSITANVTRAQLDSFYCDLIPELTVDSVFVNQSISKFLRDGSFVKVKLNKPFTIGQKITIDIYYQGTVPKNAFFSSFSQGTESNWDIPVSWTLSEPFGANQWFPCKQYLTDKADSAQVNITVAKNRMAGSSGILTRVVPVDNNYNRYEWKTGYPTAYYLLSFAVANYVDYSFYAKVNATDSVLVQNFIYNRPGYFESNKTDIDATASFIQYFSKIFGDYPFKKEKYGHCVAPIGGGMEHQTMTTLQNFNYNLVSHELAHQWFGNYVTCANWQDIWINEGFASYSEFLAIDSLKSHDEAILWMKEAHNYAFTTDGSIYVPEEYKDDEIRIFSYYLTYKKGASIIHALRYEINSDAIFFNILRTYLARFAFKNATTSDFAGVVNELSGKDYTWFFNQWYYGKGYPVYDMSWTQSGDSVFLTSVQTPSVVNSGLFEMHYDIKFIFANGDTTIRVFQDAAEKMFTFKQSRDVIDIRVNPTEDALMKVTNIAHVPEIPSFDDFIRVAPNPFTQEFKILLSAEPGGEVSIKIVDVGGKEIAVIRGKKRREIKVDAGNLAAGVYLLYVTHNNKKYIRKLIKAER